MYLVKFIYPNEFSNYLILLCFANQSLNVPKSVNFILSDFPTFLKFMLSNPKFTILSFRFPFICLCFVHLIVNFDF